MTERYITAAAAAAKSLQACSTLCDPIDGNPPGSSVPGILKARILEWVAISFSDVLKAVSLKEEISQSVQSLSRVRFFATPRTAAHQASLSITNSWNPPKPMSIVLVMPSTISSSVVPFSSCPQSLPASESFPMSQLFTTGGQSIGVSDVRYD